MKKSKTPVSCGTPEGIGRCKFNRMLKHNITYTINILTLQTLLLYNSHFESDIQ